MCPGRVVGGGGGGFGPLGCEAGGLCFPCPAGCEVGGAGRGGRRPAADATLVLQLLIWPQQCAAMTTAPAVHIRSDLIVS